MIFIGNYGRNPRIEISTVAELDEFLDKVTAAGGLYGVQIAQGTAAQWDPLNNDGAADELPVLDLGIGHPERSYLVYYGEPFGWGRDDTLTELTERLVFNCGGESEERSIQRTKVTAEQARHAAREFIKTGQRPTNVEWFEPSDDDW